MECMIDSIETRTNRNQALSPVTTREAIHGCRFCGSPLRHSVADLGMHPLCENFLTAEDLKRAETFYPLHAFVCERCFLVQVEAHVDGHEIFERDYAYFSSFSTSWLEHARHYVDLVTQRFQLNERSHIVELASNDGYLLRNFVERGIPCLGIEPAPNVAQAAINLGVPTRVEYFGAGSAQQLRNEGVRADLLIANNCLAHVHDLNDFVRGMKIILAEHGVLTVEFPTVINLIEQNQFDTIYQEHYCYFSLTALRRVFQQHEMVIFDLDELSTHGGSLRIYVRHQADETKPVLSAVTDMLELESARGFTELKTYTEFAERVRQVKRDLLAFLIQAKRNGKRVIGYGAPGKGNTLLNYCGIGEDFLDFVVDRNPYKHYRYLPGTHIQVLPTDAIEEFRPDFILLLPWNLRDELEVQLKYTRAWGAQLVVPIPRLEIF